MIYKLNIKSIAFQLLFVILIFNILFYYTTREFNPIVYIIAFVLILGLEVFMFFFIKFLTKITIKEEKTSIVLHFRKFLINDSILEVPINELLYSFKNEVGARGVKSKVLRLYDMQKTEIVSIGKGFDGWEEKTINQIIKDFKELGIKEII